MLFPWDLGLRVTPKISSAFICRIPRFEREHQEWNPDELENPAKERSRQKLQKFRGAGRNKKAITNITCRCSSFHPLDTLFCTSRDLAGDPRFQTVGNRHQKVRNSKTCTHTFGRTHSASSSAPNCSNLAASSSKSRTWAWLTEPSSTLACTCLPPNLNREAK